MMSYTFIPSLIYNAGEVASAWAVVALLFGLLALTDDTGGRNEKGRPKPATGQARSVPRPKT